MFMDIYRLLRRGDHDKPFSIYLELLYFILPDLLQLLPPEEPAHQKLIQIHYTADTKLTLRALRDLFNNYLEARAAVVRRHRLGFTADTVFEKEIEKKFKW
jgi:hypothetical protein